VSPTCPVQSAECSCLRSVRVKLRSVRVKLRVTLSSPGVLWAVGFFLGVSRMLLRRHLYASSSPVIPCDVSCRVSCDVPCFECVSAVFCMLPSRLAHAHMRERREAIAIMHSLSSRCECPTLQMPNQAPCDEANCK